MITTIKFPNATVNCHIDAITDRIWGGAWNFGKKNKKSSIYTLKKTCKENNQLTWVKENCRPVTDIKTSPIVMTKYCGINHIKWIEFSGVTWNVQAYCVNEFIKKMSAFKKKYEKIRLAYVTIRRLVKGALEDDYIAASCFDLNYSVSEHFGLGLVNFWDLNRVTEIHWKMYQITSTKLSSNVEASKLNGTYIFYKYWVVHGI